MDVKIYLVTQVEADGKERVIAARLTSGSARAVAKLDGGRRVDKLIATKSETHDPETDSPH